ncbi:MAG: Arc family DNA-binding protein [Bacteroidetes bacterium]|nr:Arc family DNA-binding protein [Bacteroidota bacterium]
MTEKKKFLLRISEDLYAVLGKWAADDLRSVNAEVEYILTEAARKSGRLKADSGDKENAGTTPENK